MRLTSEGSFKGGPATGPLESEGLSSLDELALPAICGQVGRPFLMVVRRQGRGTLELIRAVVIEPAPSVEGPPMCRADPPHRTQAGVPSRAVLSGGPGGRMPEEPDVSFQALTMRARVDIGSRYDGCPYCRARGYFHCSGCGLFSCWNRHNRKPHFNHADVWCEACRSWRCSSDEGEDDDSLSELTAYSARKNTVDLRGLQGLRRPVDRASLIATPFGLPSELPTGASRLLQSPSGRRR